MIIIIIINIVIIIIIIMIIIIMIIIIVSVTFLSASLYPSRSPMSSKQPCVFQSASTPGW